MEKMNSQRLTIGQLIDELSQFNPCAYVVTDNFDDEIKLDLSWTNIVDGETYGSRDIAKEKREASYVTIGFIVNGVRDNNLPNEL